MKRLFTALAAAVVLAGCSKNSGDTEKLTFTCTGGGGNYEMIYTDPESGKLKYAGGKELNLSLKPGKTVKVSATDNDLPRPIGLTLTVNGNKIKQDVQVKAVIEYTNVQ